MMKKSFWSVFLTLIFGVNVSLLAAHDGMGEHCKMHTKKSFDQADIDRDGSLDREEAKLACKISL
jgi:hypothetical protein